MMPPMVGTPFFSTPKGSMLGSRCTSEMFLRFMYLIKCSPTHADSSRESISVSSALNEIYDQMCAPGMSYWSRKRKM